jgi:hypothetical protein
MNQYFGLDTLMASNGITSSAAFMAYYIQVLSRRESQNLNEIGFEEWDTPQIDFEYKMLEAEDQIKVMATYVDLNSEPIPIGTKGFNTLTGSIPRQKARWILGENDYRKELIVLQNLNVAATFMNQSPGESIKNYLAKLLFGGLSEIQDAHIGSISYQVGQMKSTGSVTLTDTNNPRGIQNITFSAQIPVANITTLTSDARWFTNDDKTSEGSESDPVNDVKTRVRDLKDKLNGGSVTVEVNETSFFQDMKHSKWQVALGYAIAPALLISAGVSDAAKATAAAVAAAASDDAIKAAFKSVSGADEVIYNKTVCGVEVWDKSTKKLVRNKLQAFNVNTYLFRPSGKVGIKKNVVPLRPDPSAISATIFGGHGIIEYRYDARTKVQDWVSELTVLCVPTRPRDMYILHTK